MNVPVSNHLVITEQSYYSFADNGLLDKLKRSESLLPYELKELYKKQIWESAEKQGGKYQRRETARLMKSNGEPVEKIMKYTGLSRAAINQIKVKEE